MNTPYSSASIIEKFLNLVENHPNTPLFTFVNEQGAETESMTRQEVADYAARLGSYLIDHLKLQSGDRVLLAYPQESLDFAKALTACLYVGIVPVPVSPPNPFQLESSLPIFRAIAEDCGAVAILTNKQYTRMRQFAQLKQFMRNRDLWSNLPWHRTDVKLPKSPSVTPHKPAPYETTVLQYTSGSTATPKGVMLSNENLTHQLTYIQRKLAMNMTSTSVVWIPHFHDLCLIGCLISGIFGSGHIVLFSPLTFIRDPGLWGRLLSQYKATHTAAPDFAYLLAAKKTTHEERMQLDLSHLKVALCGAEPIRESTVNTFLEAHEVSRFDPAAFCPSYGLAEITLSAAMHGKEKASFARAPLEQKNIVQPLQAGHQDEQPITLYGCGQLDPAVDIAIVDPEQNHRLSANQVGEIWLNSPSCAMGYWGKPEITAARFHAKIKGESLDDQWYRTGDLGFVHNNEIFISGRIKDMIIENGRNIYPQDIEEMVPKLDQRIKPGRINAFGVPVADDGEHTQSEAIVVLFELREKKPSEQALDSIILNVRQGLAEQLNVFCQTIVILAHQSIVKTSSGKLKRQAMKSLFQEGALAKQTLAIQSYKPQLSAVQIESPFTEFAQEGNSDEIALWISYKLAEHLYIQPEKIDRDLPLSSYAVDSFTTISLINELSSWLGRPLPVNMSYQHLTLTQMAELLVESQASFYTMFEPGELIELPLSPQQHWLLAQQPSNHNHASLADLIELPRPFDKKIMQRSIDHLVANREMLRVRFAQEYGDWQQIIHPTAEIELEQVSIAEAQFDLETQLERLRNELDVENGPLVKIVYFDFGAKQPGQLLLLVHQFLADKKSLSVLSDQLMQQYQHLQSGGEANMPETESATYATWMMRMLNYASSERMKKHAEYWQAVSSLASPSIQTNATNHKQAGRAFAQNYVQFDVDMTNQLLLASQQDNYLTLEASLFNAVARACHEAFDEENLLIGIRHDARDVFKDIELNQTLGWLEAIYPFYSRLNLADPVQKTAVQVAEQLHELAKHGFSYGVLKHLCDEPDLNGSVANLPEPEIAFAHSETGKGWSDSKWRTTLNFTSSIVAGELCIQIDYRQDSFTTTTLDKLADLLKREIMATSLHLVATA